MLNAIQGFELSQTVRAIKAGRHHINYNLI